MRRVMHVYLATALAAGCLAATSSTAAATTDDELATALGLTGGVTASLSGPDGSAAVVANPLGDFPRRSATGAAAADVHGQDGKYLVLSTGRALDTFADLGPAAQPSTDLDGVDTATLTLSVPASESARCLALDLAMGTEERVHTYADTVPSDTISIKRDGSGEFAMHPGSQLIAQDKDPLEPVRYEVNKVDYWHAPGDLDDREIGSSSDPWIAKDATPFDHLTVVETMQVPLPAGSQPQAVTVSVSDVGNELLDSIALVDRVRVLPTCSDSGSPSLKTGLFAQTMTIRGDRGVGNSLTADLSVTTPDTTIERHDALDNGWWAGRDRGVELRFRWYQSTVGNSGSSVLSKWSAIPDADRQTFVPTVAQRGLALMVLVTGHKDGWRSETFPSPEGGWNPTLGIGNGQFIDTHQPQILDKETSAPPTRVVNGQRLTAEAIDFAPLQDSFDYQWYAENGTIFGAQNKDFVVTEAQAGKRISVKVTAKRRSFDSRPSTSAQTEPVELLVMSSTPAPRITGTARVGQKISYSLDPWSPDKAVFSQRWYVDDEVQSTTSSTFSIRPEHAGKEIEVVVTGSKAGYEPVTVRSAAVTVAAAPMTTSAPTISGKAKVGEKLTGRILDWSPTGLSTTFTWKAGTKTLRTGSDVASRSLTVPASARGQRITLTVTARKTGYESATRTSAATSTVAAGTLRPGSPRISGTARVGSTLRATAGAWSPSPVKITYRWYADGRALQRSATGSTYKIPSSLRGKRITVRITGSKTGYTTLARTSASTARVAR